MNYLLVALGSALGGVARYGIGVLAARSPGAFPIGTLIVNVAGSFLIGLLAATLGDASERSRLLLMTGFCGGFTTFSAFALENVEMMERGAFGMGLMLTVAHVVGSVGACWIGYRLGSA